MPAQLTLKEYKARIKNKFPHITVRGKYAGSNELMEHFCKTHKEVFHTTPFNMYHPRNKTGGCSICKKIKYGNTIRALREDNPAYGTSALHPKEYERRLKEAFPNLTLLSEYVTKRVLVEIQCKECTKVNKVRPGSALKVGCPYCAKRNRSTYRNYEFNLKGKKVLVQGFEAIALNWLIKKFPTRKIEVFSEGNISAIPYKFEKKEREYWPDIKIGSILVEVKSWYTLLDDPDEFNKNKAKAKACLAQGYKYKMLVCSKEKEKHTVNVLPEDWVDCSKTYVDVFYVKHKPYMITLGVDPGTTNMGFGVIKTYPDGSQEVVASGLFKRMVKSMAGVGVMQRVAAFREEVKAVVDFYKVDNICAERFMSRGLKGSTIELVSIMLAVMANIKPILFVIPAQWKNQWNRNSSLEAFYKQTRVVPHQVDALSIGMYGACAFLEFPYFTNIRTELLPKLASDINDSSEERLINRKVPKKEPVNETRNNRRKNKSSAAPRSTTRTRKARTPQASKHTVKATRGAKRKGAQTKRKATTRGKRKASS